MGPLETPASEAGAGCGGHIWASTEIPPPPVPVLMAGISSIHPGGISVMVCTLAAHPFAVPLGGPRFHPLCNPLWVVEDAVVPPLLWTKASSASLTSLSVHGMGSLVPVTLSVGIMLSLGTSMVHTQRV